MIWAEVTYANVLSHMPTDVLTAYNAWLVANPDRADRLATITANTVREFRDAIKSNPANVVYDDEDFLPQSCIRYCENIIIYTLGMEMGLTLDTAGASARVSADVFLRQIPYGRWNTTTNDDADLPTPRYSVPATSAGQVLAALVALLLGAATARGGWIKPEAQGDSLSVSYVPANYSISLQTLYGHLGGIDAKFGNAMPMSKTNVYDGNSSVVSWNFANTNGMDLFGFRFTPTINYDNQSKISVNPLISGLYFDMPESSLRLDGLGLLTYSSLANYALIFKNYNNGTLPWSHNLLYEDGYLKFADSNSFIILTNTITNATISMIGFGTTNANGSIAGLIAVYVNGTNTQYITPDNDGTWKRYDLTTYAYPWDVLELKWEMGLPNPTGTNNPPWFLNGDPALDTSVAAIGLTAQDAYGREIEFHSRPVLIDVPTAPRHAVPLAYMESSVSAGVVLAYNEIHARTAATDLQGNNFRWNPRHDTITASNDWIHKYGGQTVWGIYGDGAMVIPEIRSFQVEAGEMATLTVWSYAGGATNLMPEVCTNLVLGVWERLTNNIVSATNTDAFTAQVVFTNSLATAAFVRLVDVSGGTGQPAINLFSPVTVSSLTLGGVTRTNWTEGSGGITASDATNIAQGVVAAYTSSIPSPGCAILPVDPATSNAWITGAVEWYTITNATMPINLCISNTAYRTGYQVTILSTQAVTLATNMVRIGSAWTATGTNLVVVWPHCDPALWRVKGAAQ